MHNALVQKFGLEVRIPVTDFVHLEGPHTVTIPYLKPSDLFETVLLKEPWLLLGGSADANSRQLLQTFWRCYEKEHPDHEVFLHGRDRLDRTVPVTLHGDGGRTQKKQPLEIFSMQPVLGLNSRSTNESNQCCCETSELFGGDNPGDPLTQHINSKHNSYLTHFLIFAYPSKKYKDFKGLLLALLERACSDLGTLCATGVTGFDKEKWYPACVGFKLDMEWMAKSGSLTRSYQNVGETKEHACCHECDAGMPGVPFENVNADAEWIPTRFNTVPWRVEPPWKNIPFDTARPAKFLRRDAFHIYRLGILRNFIGSCIYLLVYMDCS